MTRYRVPYHMFFKWFVPYSRSGSFWMASLFVPVVALPFLSWKPNSGLLFFLSLVHAAWAAFTLNYHRREGLRRLLIAEAVGLAILIGTFAFSLSAPVPPVFLLGR